MNNSCPWKTAALRGGKALAIPGHPTGSLIPYARNYHIAQRWLEHNPNRNGWVAELYNRPNSRGVYIHIASKNARSTQRAPEPDGKRADRDACLNSTPCQMDPAARQNM